MANYYMDVGVRVVPAATTELPKGFPITTIVHRDKFDLWLQYYPGYWHRC